MKILLVNDICWNGGVETQMAALAAGLSARGHAVCAYFYSAGPGAHLMNGACEWLAGPNPTIGEVICDFSPDVISTNMSTVSLGFMRTIRRIGYSGGLVATCHGAVFEGWPLSGESNAVVAVSEHVASDVRRLLSTEPVVIYNGIDIETFNTDGPIQQADAPVLLWVGRSDDPNKDFPGFAAVAARVASEGWLVWIVDGAFSPRTNTLWEWLGERCTVFRGLPAEQMAAIYRGVSASGGCLLSTSSSEAFGLAVVEAMACGCPVVAPSVGGLREVVVDRKYGLVYDRGAGVGAVFNRVIEMSTSSLRGTLVGQAEARVREDFTREKMVSRYEELFMSLTKRRHYGWSCRKSVSKMMLAALRVGRTFSK